MDLKKYLGKKYKEGMTFEEIQQALADLPESDSVVDKEEYDKMKKLKDEASKEASSQHVCDLILAFLLLSFYYLFECFRVVFI